MNEFVFSPYPWQPLSEKKICCESEKTLLSVKDLTVKYNDKTVIENVNLNINEGCITALVGPSGCGKTSLLLSLNRLIDSVPNASVAGAIELGGVSVLDKKMNIRDLRTRVGLIFQKPNPFPFSIRKNIQLTLHEHGICNRDEQEHIMEQSLRSVGLWTEVCDRLNASALSLSGGQQQRLCIARAMVLRPQVLLMDEPCSSLDPVSSAVVEDLILNLRKRCTVVIITHNLAQARRISDFVGVFWMNENKGQLIEFGRTREIFETPKSFVTKAYIGGVRG